MKLTGAKASVGPGNTVVITNESPATPRGSRSWGGCGPRDLHRAANGTEQVATAATRAQLPEGQHEDYAIGDKIRIFGSKQRNGGRPHVHVRHGRHDAGPARRVREQRLPAGREPDPSARRQGLLQATNRVRSTSPDVPGRVNATQIGLPTSREQARGDRPGREPDKQNGRDLGVRQPREPPLGDVHFERQLDGKWNLSAAIDPTQGTITNPTIASLQFGPSGDLPAALATTLDVTWNGAAAPSRSPRLRQVPGSLRRAHAVRRRGRRVRRSDGYPAGQPDSIGVRADGTIEGFYTNGQIQSLAQLQMERSRTRRASSARATGLLKLSSNSGSVLLANAGTGAAGTVVSGSLEGSNVDVAEEFVRLIFAGFQANARIIDHRPGPRGAGEPG